MADITQAVIDTLIAEAGGEGEAGLIATAWAMQQRAAARGQTLDQVIRSGFDGYSSPGSGSRKNQQNPALRAQAEQILQGVTSGSIPNPVPGADHFLSGNAMPRWTENMDLVATVGGHRYYASGNVPQYAYGTPASADEALEVATLTDTVPARGDPVMASSALQAIRNQMPAATTTNIGPFTNASGDSYLQQYDFTPRGAVRSLPVEAWVQDAISQAVYAVDPSLNIRVTSGGQPSAGQGGPRLGSTRHDGGGAADFALTRNGEVLPISTNRQLYESVARNLAAQGVPGIGVDVNANFIHAGGGAEAAWGYKGKANGYELLDDGFRSAIAEGRGMAENGGIPRPPGDIPNVVGSQLDVAPTPAIRGGLLDSLKIDGVGPGTTADELAAFRGPARPRPLTERPRNDGQLVGQDRGPARSLLDEISTGATREDMNAFRGVDKAYPAELTRRPRPESYAGQERGEGYVPPAETRRNASLMEALAQGQDQWNAADGPATRQHASQAGESRSTVPMSTDAISYAGQERGEGSLLRALQEAPATDRRANFTRAADLDNSMINDFTPVTTRDGQTVVSVADMLYGDEMTTELPGGTRRNIPSGGLVGAMSEPMPTETANRSGSTRPASLLAALSGDGMAWDGSLDGPTRRAGSTQRQQTASVPTNGSYAGQERGEMVRTPNQGNMTPTNSPGIFRVAGLNGSAGNVGLPSGVRPDVNIPDFEAEWSERAPTVQRRDDIGEGANWDVFSGTFGTRQRQEPERKPNPFAYVEPPVTVAKPTQLSQEPSGQTPRFRTVNRQERYENPAYTAWKVESNRNATRADVPLGEMMYGARSRDSVAQAAAGQNFVNTQMPQQWLTRTVATQVPITSAAPVVKPVVGAPVTPRRAQATPAQNIWQNPIQGLLGALAPAGGPVQGLLGALSTRRPPSDNFLMSIGAIDDGISENHRTPSIGGGK